MIPIGLYVAHVYRTAGAHLKNLKFKAGALQRCVARRPVQISLCKRSTLTSNSLDSKLKDCSFVSLAFKLGEVCCCPALQALNPLLDLRILCIQKGRNGRNLYISISSIRCQTFSSLLQHAATAPARLAFGPAQQGTLLRTGHRCFVYRRPPQGCGIAWQLSSSSIPTVKNEAPQWYLMQFHSIFIILSALSVVLLGIIQYVTLFRNVSCLPPKMPKTISMISSASVRILAMLMCVSSTPGNRGRLPAYHSTTINPS